MAEVLRYFSPVAEVPFCGHATIALAVAYAKRHGAGTLELISPPARLTIHQGDDLGRPSPLIVDVPAGLETGIRVSGRAVPLPR